MLTDKKCQIVLFVLLTIKHCDCLFFFPLSNFLDIVPPTRSQTLLWRIHAMQLHRRVVVLTVERHGVLCSRHESWDMLGYNNLAWRHVFVAKLVTEEDQNCLNKIRENWAAADSLRTRGTCWVWNIICHRARTEQWQWRNISKHEAIIHLTKVIIWNKNKDDLLEITKQRKTSK